MVMYARFGNSFAATGPRLRTKVERAARSPRNSSKAPCSFTTSAALASASCVLFSKSKLRASTELRSAAVSFLSISSFSRNSCVLFSNSEFTESTELRIAAASCFSASNFWRNSCSSAVILCPKVVSSHFSVMQHPLQRPSSSACSEPPSNTSTSSCGKDAESEDAPMSPAERARCDTRTAPSSRVWHHMQPAPTAQPTKNAITIKPMSRWRDKCGSPLPGSTTSRVRLLGSASSVGAASTAE
mmetsp:Transcript_112922/g.315491  ORF Transcript_112922/g.315491 Transcript_112922/m.315491 type:complete len:243 (+) Transcript_112922:1332-2060(+)